MYLSALNFHMAAFWKKKWTRLSAFKCNNIDAMTPPWNDTVSSSIHIFSGKQLKVKMTCQTNLRGETLILVWGMFIYQTLYAGKVEIFSTFVFVPKTCFMSTPVISFALCLMNNNFFSDALQKEKQTKQKNLLNLSRNIRLFVSIKVKNGKCIFNKT